MGGRPLFQTEPLANRAINGVGATKLFSEMITGKREYPIAIDPRRGSIIFEEWVTASSGGKLGWTAIGSGTGATSGVGLSSNDAFGDVFVAATGNGGAARSLLYLGVNSVDLSAGKTFMEFRSKFVALSDGSDPYECWVGLGDTVAAGDPTDGLGWGYDQPNHGNFDVPYAFGGSSGTDLVLDGGGGRETSAITADAWVRRSAIIESDSSSVEFFTDGTSKGSITTNIPVSGEVLGPIIKIDKTTGSNQRLLRLDYFYLCQIFDNER